jgi:hypothetical protein
MQIAAQGIPFIAPLNTAAVRRGKLASATTFNESHHAMEHN